MKVLYFSGFLKVNTLNHYLQGVYFVKSMVKSIVVFFFKEVTKQVQNLYKIIYFKGSGTNWRQCCNDFSGVKTIVAVLIVSIVFYVQTSVFRGLFKYRHVMGALIIMTQL